MIKIKKITKKAGFTKEQQNYIADVVLIEINKNKNIEIITTVIKEEFQDNFKKAFLDKEYKVINAFINGKEEEKTTLKIELPNTKCKFELVNDFNVLIEFLARCGISVTSNSIYNKTYEQLKKCDGQVIELPDAYSDGNIAISKDIIGEVPKEENKNTIFNEKKLNDLCPKKLIKLDDSYTISKNQKRISKKMGRADGSIVYKYDTEKYTIFYKNKKDDFVVFNQKYINMLPSDCDIFLQDIETTQLSMLVAKNKENNKILALIMPVYFENLSDFNMLPEIIEEAEEVEKEQINAITGHIYTGNNAEILKNAGFTSSEWVGSAQAKKLGKQIKSDAKGVLIKVYFEDESGRSFCKLEKIYNIEELEPIKKIENTSSYQDMITRLKRA